MILSLKDFFIEKKIKKNNYTSKEKKLEEYYQKQKKYLIFQINSLKTTENLVYYIGLYIGVKIIEENNIYNFVNCINEEKFNKIFSFIEKNKSSIYKKILKEKEDLLIDKIKFLENNDYFVERINNSINNLYRLLYTSKKSEVLSELESKTLC